VSDEHTPLSAEQQHDLDELRYQLTNHLIVSTEQFTRDHLELRLTWNFTLDAHKRDEVSDGRR
jgi:hypothetical protein